MVKLITHNQKRLLFTVNMYAADDHKTNKLTKINQDNDIII